MSIQRFTFDKLPVTPWKNGGGVTREVVTWPAGAGLDDFDWRVSIATIAADGPFSVFDGIDRTIVLLEGAGVKLRSAQFEHRLDTPYEPFDFAGEEAVECSLIGGESTDLNVMSRRARGRCAVRVFDAPTRLAKAEHGLLMSVRGRWHVGGGTLAQGQGVWWAGQAEAWKLKPASRDATLVAVGWAPITVTNDTPSPDAMTERIDPS